MQLDRVPSRVRGLPSFLLHQAALPAQRLIGGGLGELGAHRTHFSLLASLEEFGPGSQAELTRRLGIDPSDMVALVNQLADDGLVRRAPNPDDRRRNLVSITEPGRRRLHQLEQTVASVQEELLAPLTRLERAELVRLLARIVEYHAATAEEGATAPRNDQEPS